MKLLEVDFTRRKKLMEWALVFCFLRARSILSRYFACTAERVAFLRSKAFITYLKLHLNDDVTKKFLKLVVGLHSLNFSCNLVPSLCTAL